MITSVQPKYRYKGGNVSRRSRVKELSGVLQKYVDKGQIDDFEIGKSNNGHYRITIKKDTDTRLLFTGSTPSDGRRALLNFEGDVRKMIADFN
jgi:hypothetical protein